MKQALGIDIGGTKIAVAAIDENGGLTNRVTVASVTESADLMYQSVTSAVSIFLTKTGTSINDYQGIGVGVPGKVDREAGVAVFQNNLPWANFPLVERLTETYGKRPIVIDNDVYQAAYAEWQAAKLADRDVFVYYTISTGIACAIIKGGEFIRGSGFAGETGLVLVTNPQNGKLERLEELASGPAMAKAGRLVSGNQELTTPELFTAYDADAKWAVELVEQTVELLTQSIYQIFCLIDPEAITFGGSLSLHQPFLIEQIRNRLATYVIPAQGSTVTRLKVSQLDNHAGIIGAGLQIFK